MIDPFFINIFYFSFSCRLSSSLTSYNCFVHCTSLCSDGRAPVACGFFQSLWPRPDWRATVRLLQRLRSFSVFVCRSATRWWWSSSRRTWTRQPAARASCSTASLARSSKPRWSEFTLCCDAALLHRKFVGHWLHLTGWALLTSGWEDEKEKRTERQHKWLWWTCGHPQKK